MPTPRRICLFCRAGCDSSSGGDLFPQFLTYLATINIDVKKEDANSCRENFHCCEKCGSLLATIAHHVQKLGQDLHTLYRVTLQNINDDGGGDDDILQIWRRQSVSQFNTSISLGKNFLENHDHEGFMRDEDSHSQTENETPSEFDIKIKNEVSDQEEDRILEDLGVLYNRGDNHSSLEVDIPPEKGDELYLNDILDLADDPQLKKKASSSHKRRITSVKKLETTKIIKLSESRSSITGKFEICPKIVKLKVDNFHATISLDDVKIEPELDDFTKISASDEDDEKNPVTSNPDIFYPDVELKVEPDEFVMDDNDDDVDSGGKDPLDLCEQDKPVFYPSSLPPGQRIICHPRPKSTKPVVPFPTCATCGATFPMSKDLHHHIALAHPEVPNPFKCPTCGQVFTSSWADHVKTCQVVGGESATRLVPVQTSHTTWSYLGVEISHVAEDTFSCGSCEYTHRRKSNVMNHIRCHHASHLPFRCGIPTCGRPFLNQVLLDEHIAKSGHGSYSEACKFCGKELAKRAMRHHVLSMHEKSTRFVCTTCGKGFTIQSACTIHESSCGLAKTPRGKQGKLTAEEKLRFDAARESILGEEIVSNECKHCSKRIFGSLASLSFHEEKCGPRHGRSEEVSEEEEVLVRRGVRLIADAVEVSHVVVITEPRVIRMHKCGACGKTFLEKYAAVGHVVAEHRSGDSSPQLY